ncbi:hypothetical protein [Thalassobellus suaedae]|uniref:Uncharacterized protein n=1 Tax=Thalassobellus suaedae TaxID=3074124 RepID=A0ABY9XW74_9FLAO|nr:hypothetical protein RHP51_04990 [Flavobacteriaceae bacterium HL-DH14]
MIYGIIILLILIVYLFIKVKKIENNQLEAKEMPKGNIIIKFKGKEIYNANPKD